MANPFAPQRQPRSSSSSLCTTNKALAGAPEEDVFGYETDADLIREYKSAFLELGEDDVSFLVESCDGDLEAFALANDASSRTGFTALHAAGAVHDLGKRESGQNTEGKIRHELDASPSNYPFFSCTPLDMSLSPDALTLPPPRRILFPNSGFHPMVVKAAFTTLGLMHTKAWADYALLHVPILAKNA
ncbi:hypothetical protein EV363DRAFT_1446234 [Boletus edulis]|nr:hypothetical protein EV363DRAFT_1446234 [Boletus edulis]